MITTPILLILYMHIGPTKLFKTGAPNAGFDAKQRLYPGSTGLDQDESGKIEKAIIANKDNKDEKDPQEKNR